MYPRRCVQFYIYEWDTYVMYFYEIRDHLQLDKDYIIYKRGSDLKKKDLRVKIIYSSVLISILSPYIWSIMDKVGKFKEKNTRKRKDRFVQKNTRK